MFTRLGRFAADRARAVLVLSVLVVVAASALGFTAFGKLKTDGGFSDPGSESSQAQELVDREFGGGTDVVFLMTAGSGGVDDPAHEPSGPEGTRIVHRRLERPLGASRLRVG